jgi:predicted extracellular nuclease
MADLFFSEYIEGSSNNKALEIYNGTGAAIDLAAAGYVVQTVLQRQQHSYNVQSDWLCGKWRRFRFCPE